MPVKLDSAVPERSIAHLVENFWSLEGDPTRDVDATILPDGLIDLFLERDDKKGILVSLKGIDTEPSQVVVPRNTKIFAASFRLPAVEALFHHSIGNLLNIAESMSNSFWGFESKDLEDFQAFCRKVTRRIKSAAVAEPDPRKQKLFELLYSSHGSIPISNLSAQVYWSTRQINRYFTEQFGIPLKLYCRILRFRASFGHIKRGKLFPEENFFDQAHFIKEVKKLSGVLPKALKRNENGRFLQFSAIDAG